MNRLALMLLTLLLLIPAALWLVIPHPTIDWDAVSGPDCDLDQSTCSAHLADGRRLWVRIGPRPVPLLAPIEVELKTRGMQVVRAAVGITGVEVDMGLTTAPFTHVGEKIWLAHSELGVCSRSEMSWRVTVELELEGGDRVHAGFPLHTRYRPKFVIVGE